MRIFHDPELARLAAIAADVDAVMTWTTPKTWTVGSAGTSSDMNTFVSANTAFLYGDTTWNPVGSFTNGWTNFTGYTAGYRKIGTRVALNGVISSGTVNAAAFTLPTGYRPAVMVAFAVASNGAFGEITVSTAGVVIPAVGSNVGFHLEAVVFDTF